MFVKPRFRLMVFLVGAFCLIGAAASLAAEGYESHADKFAGGYTGAASCLVCHKDAADEVIDSVHYQWRSENPNIEYPGGGAHGMVDRACGLVGSSAIINYDQQCGKCHVGDTLPFPNPQTGEYSLTQKHNLDCLICHAGAGQYDTNADGVSEVGEVSGDKPWQMDEARGREAWYQDRRVEAAQSVGAPVSNDACLRCHHHGQADPTYKRGTPYEEHTDVHAAKGMLCTACHEVSKHKMASGTMTTDMYSIERPDVEVSCSKCHTDAPHKTLTKLNDHTDRIACETCHIPEVAGAERRVWGSTMGVTEGDESNVPTLNTDTGQWEPFTILSGPVSPSYRWYGGAASMLAEPIDKPYAFNMMPATKQTPGAKIMAFRKFVSGQPMDANGLPGTANFSEMFTMGAALKQMAPGLKMMGFMRPDGMTIAEEAMMGMFPNMLLFDRAEYFARGGMSDAISIGMAKMGAVFQGVDYSTMTREQLIGMGSQMWSGNIAVLDLPNNPMAPGAVDDQDPRTVTGSMISVSHAVKLEGALSCADCHRKNGRLDFAELGYAEDMVTVLESVLDDEAPDHSNFIGAAYTGPTQCQICHPGKVAEMQGGTHYKFESDLPEGYQYDHDDNPVTFTRSGKLWKLCGFPTAFAAANWLGKLKDLPETAYIDKPGGCAKCHVGIGTKPFTATGNSEPQANEADNMDCLICHAANYSRKFYVATEAGEPKLNAMDSPVVMAVPQTDGVRDFSVYTEAAKTVGHTSAATCLRCHVSAGGGKLPVDDLNETSFKRGSVYAPDMDVHAAAGLSCSDCHYAGGHRFKRPLNNDLSAHDVVIDHQMCLDCHGQAPHKQQAYNKHLEHIACTTCHTRTPGGASYKDFSSPVAPNAEDPLGLWGVEMVKTTSTAAVKYTWFNGSVGPELAQRGSRGDGLIYPYKVIDFNQPLDVNNNPIPVKWGKFFLTGDMEAAVALGRSLYESMYSTTTAAATGLPAIPGELDHYGQNDVGGFSISHGITKTDALKCNDCHSADGPMDFALLGYDDEKQVELMAIDLAPNLSSAIDRRDGSVDLNWTNDNKPEPRNFLGFAYDYYTGEWVKNASNGSIWFPFKNNTLPSKIRVGNTGLYSFWISTVYPDNSWSPTATPQTLIVQGVAPHTPINVDATDQGNNVIELTWKPDVYGTWLYWVILYDADNSQWVQVDGPLGNSLWQYTVWGSNGFTDGVMELEVPASANYYAYIAGMAWDGETIGDFEVISVKTAE